MSKKHVWKTWTYRMRKIGGKLRYVKVRKVGKKEIVRIAKRRRR